MSTSKIKNRLALTVLSIFCATSAASWTVDDHDEVVGAVKSGRSVRLSEILPGIEDEYRARVINIEMLERGEAIIYKLYMLGERGNLQYLFLNAIDGRIIGSRGVKIILPDGG